MAQPHIQPPVITFRGAAQTVTGSQHLVEAGGVRLLLDCGLFQGKRSEAIRRNRQFPFHPHQLDAVLLTHAHIDHCGNLPNLVRQGFHGPILCTPATRDLLAVMLMDAAKVQEEDALHLNILRNYAEPWIHPLYSSPDVQRALGQVQAVSFGQSVTIGDVEARFHRAGHILGSAMVHLTAGPAARLTYTGDLGRRTGTLLPPEPVPECDLLVCEATYGGRCHPPVAEALTALADIARRTLERGGTLLVPAFSLGRTQLVVHHLVELMDAGIIPQAPITVDGPLATQVMEVYTQHDDAFAEAVVASQRRARYVRSFEESARLAAGGGSGILIAASGMCEAGRIIQHLAQHLPDERCAVALVSFQASRTLGRQLADGATSVRLMGRDWPVRAEVVTIRGFSGHADHDDILGQLAPLARVARATRLIHGDPDAVTQLATALTAAGFHDVAAPASGDRLTWGAA